MPPAAMWVVTLPHENRGNSVWNEQSLMPDKEKEKNVEWQVGLVLY